ncbi:phosphoribosylformylglycinamidine synthase [Atopobium deltae]|uniref:Phosphoribosylformylglycinamidine synthase n=1 Tax=Atopobium deltae TaxID=1393034 RepID=A0A133XVX4_9ACTN|nr:phosphoribosylformylglycinamidine synthase [Atopobium deltae]KXB35081.1 phosphoribosylformylglycinamidine synthase [Atopobium deltae]
MVLRVFVEKRPEFAGKAHALLGELQTILGIHQLKDLRIINRYDVEGISQELFERCIPLVFSEPQVDVATTALPATAHEADASFVVEFLPGQFDQRAESASECIQLISQGERPSVRSAKLYLLFGDLTGEDIRAIKHYVINPVEAREAPQQLPHTLQMQVKQPQPIKVLDDFCDLNASQLADFLDRHGLAMDLADLEFCQAYFKEEHRAPTITEIKVIDTYWSDHCRHTTFNTQLDEVACDDPRVEAAFKKYLELRRELGRDKKPVSLMDMGTIGAKYLKHTGQLRGLDESDEINACTVKVRVDVNGHDEDWLFLFKNETHNHPTEIEPFGGAATCIGGAIRDPLSGRSYVYQAMRITGAGDPFTPVEKTLPGKLPQRKIVTTAAAGYSSYGNQIGLATGEVHELYHPGYVAKHMELGAVVGATPQDHVRREEPAPDDCIILLGGRTGRDGIGGATGSSKAHTHESLEDCGAEVQKGNAPIERKLQRLFRRKDACQLIKRCNDFGAGGVSVAIGELACGLLVNLDAIPKKYEGLDGTELAISESQERMAVALDPRDIDEFMHYAHEENLEATVVAKVTQEKRLVMQWAGEKIVDISRAFLNSNGAPKHQNVHVAAQKAYRPAWSGAADAGEDTSTTGKRCFAERMEALVQDLNVACNKGLAERFDSTIGAATVLMPYGGSQQLTPALAMVAKLPVDGITNSCSGMSWGFNPYLSEADQYAGAYCAVAESLSKLVASGFKRENAYLTFQEYFERLGEDPARWGKPTASVLGALMAQLDLGVGSIGGKDSMSGSFEDLDVPATLVSFAVATGKVDHVTSPEFKAAGHHVIAVVPSYQADGITPEGSSLVQALDFVQKLIEKGVARSVSTPGYGGVAEALFKMCVGNRVGMSVDEHYSANALLHAAYGSFLVELSDEAMGAAGDEVASTDGHELKLPEAGEKITIAKLGMTTQSYCLKAAGSSIDLAHLQELWEGALENVYPYRSQTQTTKIIRYKAAATPKAAPTLALGAFTKPRVIIPVFPGTNCEYDSAQAFIRAGAAPQTFVINNLTPQAVAASSKALAQHIRESQIIMLPGGFSGGDEPDGSAKFITAFFRAPEVTEAVRELLQKRDGLILGICNGFQALIKLGLVPYGDIIDITNDCPTLTNNVIGRHQSRLVHTRICSTKSVWLSRCALDEVHTIAISHGEGRFVASDELVARLESAGQIATQYCDEKGTPGMGLDVNPNGSVFAIEGITSPDGRILGKMGHSERAGKVLYKNVTGNRYQPLFEGGVSYFSD